MGGNEKGLSHGEHFHCDEKRDPLSRSHSFWTVWGPPSARCRHGSGGPAARPHRSQHGHVPSVCPAEPRGQPAAPVLCARPWAAKDRAAHGKCYSGLWGRYHPVPKTLKGSSINRAPPSSRQPSARPPPPTAVSLSYWPASDPSVTGIPLSTVARRPMVPPLSSLQVWDDISLQFGLYFHNDGQVGCLFIGSLVICMYLEKYQSSLLIFFLIRLFCVLLGCRSFVCFILYIFWMLIPCQIYHLQICLPFCKLLSILLIIFFFLLLFPFMCRSF